MTMKKIYMFTPKDERFKDKGFLHGLKEIYTDLINRHISDPTQHLKVFDPNGVYLPTKKIGKNNCFSGEKQKERLPTTENLRKFITALCMCIQFATIFSGRLQDCTYFDTPGTLQSKDDRGKWHPPLGKGNLFY